MGVGCEPLHRAVPLILLPLPPLVLHFIYCPHSSLSSLHSHKTLVKAEVVTHCILPGGSVMSEVEEHGSEPVVNLIQSPLFVWRLQDRPSYQVSIGVRRPDVVVFVTLNAGNQIWEKMVRSRRSAAMLGQLLQMFSGPLLHSVSAGNLRLGQEQGKAVLPLRSCLQVGVFIFREMKMHCKEFLFFQNELTFHVLNNILLNPPLSDTSDRKSVV